ncbi:MAG: protein kinase, partial [Isosphaeraceae bacterium]
PVYAFGCAEGVHYYALLFIDGQSLALLLADLCEASPPPGSATPPRPCSGDRYGTRALAGSWRSRAHVRAVAGLGLQAAEGLAAAHDEGVVHRDVKPANLMVDDHGHLWITDFGVARLQADSGLTLSGDLLGTLRYMSPEQALGRRAMVDHRCDLYGLGVTLHELLTLRRAFDGSDQRELLRQILDEEPIAPRKLNPAVPRDLETIVQKAMAKEPAERYPSAHAMADDLRRFLDGRPILATRPGPLDHARKFARRHRRIIAATTAAVALLTVLTLAGLSWANSRLRLVVARLEVQKNRADHHSIEETRLRHLADRRLTLANRHLHAARLHLASQALEQNQFERAQDVLEENPFDQGGELHDFAWHYLRARSREEIVQFPRHSGEVTEPRLINQGKGLVYGTVGGEVWFGDLDTETVRPGTFRHPREINDVVVSQDGRRLVTSSFQTAEAGGEVRIWDLPDGRPIGNFEMPRGVYAQALWLSHDGGTLTLWAKPTDEGTPQEFQTFDLSRDPGHPTPGRKYPWMEITAPTPLGRSYRKLPNGTIEEFDILTGARLRILPHRLGSRDWPDVSPDGRVLIHLVLGETPETILLDLDSGEVARRYSPGHLYAPHLWATRDSRLVLMAGSAGPIVLWDRATNAELRIEPQGMDREKARLSPALSEDGRYLAYTTWGMPGGQEPIRIFDRDEGEVVATYPGRSLQVGEIAFDADGASLLIESGNSIKRWWFRRGERKPVAIAGHSDEAWSVAFSPNGRYLASGGDDTTESRTVKLWDARTGELVRGWRGGPATIVAVAFSPNNRLLATAGLEQSDNLRLWDARTGRLRRNLVGHEDRVRALAFSPDGRFLASAGSDRLIHVWNPTKGQRLASLIGHEDTVRQVAFSPDSRTLVSVSNDSTARFWDVPSGKPGPVVIGPSKRGAVAYSPRGDRVAAADESGLVVFLDPADGSELGRINSEDGEVRALAFSPDGQALAAAGMDRKIRLWDVLTGQELLVLKGHEAQINGLAFSPDGRTLASCSHDGVVKLWSSREVNDP